MTTTTTGSHIRQVIRCPYCVEGDDFSAMMPRGDGQWFWCAQCAHVVIPEQPAYQCDCGNCIKVLNKIVSQ